MSVIESARWLRAPSDPGGFGSVTFEYFTRSSATTVILPSPSTRSSAGFASAPVPRMTARYAFLVDGWITRSLTATAVTSVPRSDAIF